MVRAPSWPILALAAALAACQPAAYVPEQQVAMTSPPPTAAPAPPPAPRNPRHRVVKVPGVANTAGLDAGQIEAMFDAAVAQSRPFPGRTAVCAGMRGPGEREMRDAPAHAVARLSRTLRLPAVPASQCDFGVEPVVAATGAVAMLYTVTVEDSFVSPMSFWAVAAYGNLGANGARFRLVRKAGRWAAEPTGEMVVS